MKDLVRETLARPSRLIGWGVVALVHVIAWQVLVNGLNWTQVLPVLKSVEVVMVNEPPTAMPPAALPAIDLPVNTPVFVPTPEVKVAQESPALIAVTTVPPPVTATEVAPTPASAPTYSTSPVVVSEADVAWLVKPEVKYPMESKRAKERGTVLLSVIVNAQGMVEYVNVFKSSGFSRLDECATRAVRRMRVKPYLRNGIATAVEVRFPVEFS